MMVRRAAAALMVCFLAGCSAEAASGLPTPTSTAGSTTTASTTSTAPTPEPTSEVAPTVSSPTVSSPTASSTPVHNPDLDQPLIDAAWANDVARAQQLISEGADVNAQDSTQQSAYLIATSEGYLDLLELTLANGADLTSLDSYRGTGLIRAGERGHAGIVGRLLQVGIDVNHVNRPGWTALDEAIVYGDGSTSYADTVRALVAGGADLVRIAGDGRTPIQHAESAGQDVIVTTLQTAMDAGPSDPAQATGVLLQAAADGDADRVAIALRAGAPIESVDDHGRTALLLASAADHLDVARLLVVLGADPDRQDNQQDSAWLVTGVTGSVEMLEVLLPAHPDLVLRNRFGGVSVIPASERGHVEYVRRVVSTGIDVNHVNDLGWTAMLEAIVYGDGSRRYQQIIEILLAAGADPKIVDANGISPLQHAQDRGFGIIADQLEAALASGR